MQTPEHRQLQRGQTEVNTGGNKKSLDITATPHTAFVLEHKHNLNLGGVIRRRMNLSCLITTKPYTNKQYAPFNSRTFLRIITLFGFLQFSTYLTFNIVYNVVYFVFKIKFSSLGNMNLIVKCFIFTLEVLQKHRSKKNRRRRKTHVTKWFEKRPWNSLNPRCHYTSCLHHSKHYGDCSPDR